MSQGDLVQNQVTMMQQVLSLHARRSQLVQDLRMSLDSTTLNVHEALDLRDTQEGLDAGSVHGPLFIAESRDTAAVACQRDRQFIRFVVPTVQSVHLQ